MAGVTYPVANTMVKRQKEIELRRALRTMRTALDRFQFDVRTLPRDSDQVPGPPQRGRLPRRTRVAHTRVSTSVTPSGRQIKYLRRLPLDPITGEDEWDTRSSRDDPGIAVLGRHQHLSTCVRRATRLRSTGRATTSGREARAISDAIEQRRRQSGFTLIEMLVVVAT